MTSNLRILGRLLLIGTVLTTVGSRQVARAQEDNEPVDDDNPRAVRAPAAGRVVMIQPALNLDQMDQWVFGRLGGSAGARNKLDSSLLLRIEDLERTCNTSPNPRRTSSARGSRGDSRRFYDSALKRSRESSSRHRMIPT